VRAVTLGGLRAEGTHRPDSDWDFSLYYRGRFDPQTLRDIGWPGAVSEIGGWGDGVFNGGAWLEIDGRRCDVHYRDLDFVDRELAEASEGRFRIEPLMFHLAGIPSYLVLAELAVKQVLRGQLPTPDYPAALRARAPGVWWNRPEPTAGPPWRRLAGPSPEPAPRPALTSYRPPASRGAGASPPVRWRLRTGHYRYEGANDQATPALAGPSNGTGCSWPRGSARC
jgi:hypothetical protein